MKYCYHTLKSCFFYPIGHHNSSLQIFYSCTNIIFEGTFCWTRRDLIQTKLNWHWFQSLLCRLSDENLQLGFTVYNVSLAKDDDFNFLGFIHKLIIENSMKTNN